MKLLVALIQITLSAAALCATSACAEDRHEASGETANQMCVIIDDKLVCAPMAQAGMQAVSMEAS